MSYLHSKIMNFVKSYAERNDYLLVSNPVSVEQTRMFAENNGQMLVQKPISIDFLKQHAGEREHVVVQKTRFNKLRRRERCANSIADSLAKKVLAECLKNGVNAESWAEGIPEEIIAWTNYLAKGLIINEADFRHSFLLDRDFEFEKDLPANGPITALDIGCAVKVGFGRKLSGREISITAADPLAYAYNALLDLHGIERGFSLEWGVAEMTSDTFGAERFDFVLADNSIDHGYDPRLAFEQIAKSLKRGGVARFSHWENEAEFEEYAGFHQWNLEPHGDRVRVWNRSTDMFVDFHDFGCTAEIEMTERPVRNNLRQRAFSIRLKKG